MNCFSNFFSVFSPATVLMALALCMPLATINAQAQVADKATAELPQNSQSQQPEAATITYLDGLVLGLVEGLTEFLPVSSTGHLILVQHWLGLEAETPLTKADGSLHLVDKAGEQQPFTLKQAVDGYIIIIQFGAILAVVILYWKRIVQIIQGVLGRNPQGLLLLRNLILAFLPAAVIGLLIDDWIESVLFGITPVLIALVAGAVLMLIVERIRRRMPANSAAAISHRAGPELHEISPLQSVVIGLMQCVAMWPGTSRSMMTIVGGYVVGFSPARAAEFSFLLGLITLSAASLYKSLTVGPAIIQTLPAGPIIFGLLVAGFSAMAAVHWFVGFLTRRGLAPFAYYRIVLAIICAVVLLQW